MNEFGQEIGEALPDWERAEIPSREVMEGRYCRLEPLVVRHAENLWEVNQLDEEGRNWTYLPYGPFCGFEEYAEWVGAVSVERDPQFYAVIVEEKAVGVASYLRIDSKIGSIEVGHIHFSESSEADSGSDRGDVSHDATGF